MLACIALYAHAKNDEQLKATAKLTRVTVYRNGAEMVHNVNAQLAQGNNELMIENISNKIDINSVQVKSADAVTVQNIEFSNNYLPAEQPTKQELLWKDSLNSLQKELDKINMNLNNTIELQDVLHANKDIKGTQTGLSVAELQKLMDYYKTKSLELSNDADVWLDKKTKLAEKIIAVKNQLAEEQKKNVTTSGRLLLKLSVALSGKYSFTVSYIALNAYWSPYYDVKVTNTKDPIKLISKAKIVQTTGIDWKQVKLSLATSVPSLFGNAPELQAWYVGYIDPVALMDKKMSAETMLQGRVVGVSVQGNSSLQDIVVVGYGSSRSDEYVESNKPAPKPVYVVDGALMDEYEFQKINPNAIKKMDVLKGGKATALYGSRAEGGAIVVELKNELQDYVSVATNTLDISYDIDMPMDIPTNGKEQTATLQTQDVAAIFKHYDAPKLDKDAYLLADITNWGKLNLLPGDANVIVEGTYVGKTFIDPASSSDTMHLTLGVDKRVIVKRDKITDYSSTKFLGSNKQQKFVYQLSVKNNKTEQVNLLLKDQFPLSTNKEIDVEIIDEGGAVLNKDTGLLNWNIVLAAGESRTVKFAYTIKYPKDKTLNL
jgi:hypothetical protein